MRDERYSCPTAALIEMATNEWRSRLFPARQVKCLEYLCCKCVILAATPINIEGIIHTIYRFILTNSPPSYSRLIHFLFYVFPFLFLFLLLRRPDVKLWQCLTLMREVEQISAARDVAVIVCGDFNRSVQYNSMQCNALYNRYSTAAVCAVLPLFYCGVMMWSRSMRT